MFAKGKRKENYKIRDVLSEIHIIIHKKKIFKNVNQ